jgi:hypothetical protein
MVLADSNEGGASFGAFRVACRPYAARAFHFSGGVPRALAPDGDSCRQRRLELAAMLPAPRGASLCDGNPDGSADGEGDSRFDTGVDRANDVSAVSGIREGGFNAVACACGVDDGLTSFACADALACFRTRRCADAAYPCACRTRASWFCPLLTKLLKTVRLSQRVTVQSIPWLSRPF